MPLLQGGPWNQGSNPGLLHCMILSSELPGSSSIFLRLLEEIHMGNSNPPWWKWRSRKWSSTLNVGDRELGPALASAFHSLPILSHGKLRVRKTEENPLSRPARPFLRSFHGRDAIDKLRASTGAKAHCHQLSHRASLRSPFPDSADSSALRGWQRCRWFP